jgi:pimeloyl-ACP methyl ester carboxylesterase
VSLYLALEHPELVEGLALLDTTSYLSGFLLQRWIAAAVVLFGSAGCRISDRGFKAVKALAAAFSATAPFCRPEAKVVTGRECYKVDNHVMVKTINSFRRFDVTERLGEIDAPTLIVVGTVDMLADLRHARRMTNGITGSQMVAVRGAGHMALLEKPGEVDSAIAAFLERVHAPARRVEKAQSG